QVGRHRFQAVDLGERTIGVLEHLGALRRHARERAALSHEQIEAELALERLEGPADRWMRGAERRGGLGHRQAMTGDRDGVLELMEIHSEHEHTPTVAVCIITNGHKKMAAYLSIQ